MTNDELEALVEVQRETLKSLGFTNVLICASIPEKEGLRWFSSHDGKGTDLTMGVCVLGRQIVSGIKANTHQQ